MTSSGVRFPYLGRVQPLVPLAADVIPSMDSWFVRTSEPTPTIKSVVAPPSLFYQGDPADFKAEVFISSWFQRTSEPTPAVTSVDVPPHLFYQGEPADFIEQIGPQVDWWQQYLPPDPRGEIIRPYLFSQIEPSEFVVSIGPQVDWWQQTSEPVRPIEFIEPTAHGAYELEPALIEENRLDKWFRATEQPLFDRVDINQYLGISVPMFEFFTTLNFWSPSYPDLIEATPRAVDTGWWDGILVPQLAIVLPDRWFREIQQPIFEIPPAIAGEQTIPPDTTAEAPLLKWYQPASEPIFVAPFGPAMEGWVIGEPLLDVEPVSDSWHRPTETPPRALEPRQQGYFDNPLENTLFATPDLSTWYRPLSEFPGDLETFYHQIKGIYQPDPQTVETDEAVTKWWQPTNQPPRARAPRHVGIFVYTAEPSGFGDFPDHISWYRQTSEPDFGHYPEITDGLTIINGTITFDIDPQPAIGSHLIGTISIFPSLSGIITVRASLSGKVEIL